MAITIITGVPGTGKTAYLVSELEKIAKTGRKIFVDNISGLKIEHYRAGKITEWQKGTWLHIDRYKRKTPAAVIGGKVVEVEEPEDDDGNGNENWEENPEVLKDEDENYHRMVFDESGQAIGTVPYESHKGALLVIDEAQRHFRPRPAGAAVPDHVAALEVHRHQGLDIWLVTQRPGLIDANVRALCGKHIALRSTPFGRYKYEWPEVGDIESKVSRDTSAKSRYKLPKHVFNLYKSAEAHTKHKHSLPLAAKIAMIALPLTAFFLWSSYKTISSKFKPKEVVQAGSKNQSASGNIVPAVYKNDSSEAQPKNENLPIGFEVYEPLAIQGHHPFEGKNLHIVGRVHNARQDRYSFLVAENNGQGGFNVSSEDLRKAGYTVFAITDCSVKLSYKDFEFFVSCGAPGQNNQVVLSPYAAPTLSDQLPSGLERY